MEFLFNLIEFPILPKSLNFVKNWREVLFFTITLCEISIPIAANYYNGKKKSNSSIIYRNEKHKHKV